jgi:hypothetical protein
MRLLPIVFALGLAGVALTETALGLMGPRSVATDGDWESASQRVRKDLAANDLIVFAPLWVDQTGRQHLGDVMPLSMVGRSDADAYARVWELSIRGAHAPECAGLTPELEEHFGRVTLRRYSKPAQQIVRDLVDDFVTAEVGLRSGDAAIEPCPVDGAFRRCGAVKVGPRTMEIDYRPRRGVLAPVVAGKTLVITYPEVPAGKLVGYVGLHDYYARKSADGVVQFRVGVDESQSVLLPVRSPPANEAPGPDGKVPDGWRRFDLDLGPGTHRVRFELSSDLPAARLPGFAAQVRAP